MRRTAHSRAPRRTALVGAALVSAVGLSACAAESSEGIALDYWLWDSNQLIPYQQCIDQFEEQNPDITVRLSQYGYGDYWTKLTAGFVAGSGPDVLTNHLSRYPEYVQRGLLLDLNELEATADISSEEYQDGLTDLWVGQDGGQYGIPKDFDSIGLFYNEEMLQEAGLTPDDLAEMEWNPEDGGSFEQVIARLTVDTNGVRGDEEGFDPSSIDVYGFEVPGGGDAAGQTQWSWLAGSMGWESTNADVWGDEYNLDDERLHESLEWLYGLPEKGYMAPYVEVGSGDFPTDQRLGAQRVAMVTEGSWMIRSFTSLDGVNVGIASLPAGPIGHPVSMYNGLADSVTADTEHPEEAAELVAHLGSTQCQDVVADSAVVLPARPESTDRAVEVFAEDGIDVTPFTDVVEDGHTMFFPVTENFSTINSMVTPTLEEMYIGTSDRDDLIEVNERVNRLFD